VSWRFSCLAVASAPEGPDEGIPKDIDNRGAHIVDGGGRTPPPHHHGAGVPTIQGDTPRDRMKGVYRPRREDQQNRDGSVGQVGVSP
jgi:hypothetical protein